MGPEQSDPASTSGKETDDEGTDPNSSSDTEAGPRRVIKRYSNRKLYDTRDSRYVTLLQIAELVRQGDDVQIIDNSTKEDKTDVTLALIISEELKARPKGIPLSTLKALIRQRSGRLFNQLRDGKIGKLMPREEEVDLMPAPDEEQGDVTEGSQKGFRATLEHWQHAIDERIRTVLPNFSAFRELQSEVQRLSDRLDALEQRLERQEKSDPQSKT